MEYPGFSGTIRHYDFHMPISGDLWIRRRTPDCVLEFARPARRTLAGAWLHCSAVRRHRTDYHGEHMDLTGSWDAHPVPLPCSQLTPVGPWHHTVLVLQCCPRCQYDEGSNGLTISGLNHTASALAVYASRQALLPDMQDSLAAGGEPLRRGSRTLWASKKFQFTMYP